VGGDDDQAGPAAPARFDGKAADDDEAPDYSKDEAFRGAMPQYVEKLLSSNQGIFREVRMTDEEGREVWDRRGWELGRLGEAETDAAKKIERVRDDVLAGLTRMGALVDAVNPCQHSAMNCLRTFVYSWLRIRWLPPHPRSQFQFPKPPWSNWHQHWCLPASQLLPTTHLSLPF
jgi:hypothetical protein